MRWGCYSSLDNVGRLRDVGFDYMAVDAVGLLGGNQASQVWEAQAIDPQQSALPMDVAYSFWPSDFPIVGPDVDLVQCQNVMQRVAKRAQRLGIRYMTLEQEAWYAGDPAAPPSVLDQLVTYLRMAGQIGAHHGVTLAVQPIGGQYLGIGDALRTTRTLLEKVNHPHVGVCLSESDLGGDAADEPALLALGQVLKHVRLSGRAPLNPSDLAPIFSTLHKMGYGGYVTIDGDRFEAAAGGEAAAEVAGGQLEAWRQAWIEAGRLEG